MTSLHLKYMLYSKLIILIDLKFDNHIFIDFFNSIKERLNDNSFLFIGFKCLIKTFCIIIIFLLNF